MREKFILLGVIFFPLLFAAKTDSENKFSFEGLNNFFKEKNCDPNCTFNVPLPNSITSKTLPSFPTSCNTVCADIVINDGCDLTEQQLTTAFQNMKKLIGGFTMVQTNYTSAKFLAGLESIECYDEDMLFLLNPQLLELGLTNFSTIACPGIHLTANARMKKLNIPNLKTFIPTEPNSSVVNLWLTPDGSDFCLTTEEIKRFMSIDTADVDHMNGKYCDPVINENMCKKPAIGCTEIIGDVEVNSEFNLETMKAVEVIYGSLTIKGTTLTNLSFLENLKYVATLEHKPAISIEGNKNLTNYDFPKLKRIRSDSSNTMAFQYNNKILSDDPKICYGIRSALNLGSMSPTIDDSSCEVLEKMAKYKAERNESSLWQLSGFLLVFAITVMDFFSM